MTLPAGWKPSNGQAASGKEETSLFHPHKYLLVRHFLRSPSVMLLQKGYLDYNP
jgi:hypothetical protein